VYSGLSFAYGSGWWLPGLKFGKPALAAESMPPSQAGIVPAALPAFSAPSGVSSRAELRGFGGTDADQAAGNAAPATIRRGSAADREQQGFLDHGGSVLEWRRPWIRTRT
jgi:hypothetical protein